MTFTLRRDLCLVKLAPAQRETASGLVLAEGLPAPTCYGKVVQIGADVQDVAVGDVVLFPPTVGDPMTEYFPTPHLLIPEQAIDAVIGPREDACPQT